MEVKRALILSILAIFCAVLMQTAAAAPLEVPLPSDYLYVGPGGFSTIQDAVDAATPGDVIVVAPGVYYENVEVYKENITIISENESNPAMVVAANPELPVFYITANNVSIMLLHVAGASNFSSAILAENVNFTVVLGNFIENSTYGVNLVNCYYSQVVCNKIANNEFAGVRLFHSMVANVSCNYFWNNSLYGIYAYNVSISWNTNNFIGLGDTGINYVHSEGYQALGNYIVNTTYGIAVSYLFYGDILENGVVSNSSGNGINATHAFYLGIYNNFAKGYFKGIYVSDSAMGAIAYNHILKTKTGLSLRYSYHYSIENNTIMWSETGLYLSHCNTTSVQGNALLQSCLRSIYACEVQEVLFARNQVNTSSCGFYLYFANSCAVEENMIFNHTSYGIHLYNSTYLDVHGNYLLACGIGIFAEANSSYNFIFLNAFLNNFQHALCYDSFNTWNTPEPVNYTYGDQNYTNFLGNYWDDYEGPDNNHDGIGDVPYPIEEHNADNYPLVFIPFGPTPPPPPPPPPIGNYTFNTTLHIVAGWNLISIPLVVEDVSVEGAPPEILEGLVLYGWNETACSYYEAEYPEPGKGYWLYSPATFNLTLYGNGSLPDYEASLPAGWHLLGSVYGSTAIVNCTEGVFYPSLYGWNPYTSQYYMTQLMEEGRGYWFLTYTPAYIHVYPYPPLPP